MLDLRFRMRNAVHVVPLPVARDAWLVWDADQEQPDGPYPAVAIAVVTEDPSWAEETETTTSEVEARGRTERRYHYHPTTRFDHDDPLEWPEIRVLILPPEFGAWENPWVEQMRVYFSREAAEEALQDRRKRAAHAG